MGHMPHPPSWNPSANSFKTLMVPPWKSSRRRLKQERCHRSQALEIASSRLVIAVAKWDKARHSGTWAEVGDPSKMRGMNELRWVLLDAEGRVRSGWGIAAFWMVTIA